MGYKKWWDIVSKKRSKCLEKSEIDGKKGILIPESANYWYALGSSFIAIGSLGISLGPATSSPKLLLLYFFSGFILVIAGVSMINGAYAFEKESEKPSVVLSLKELQHTNKGLYRGFLALIVWAFLMVIAYLWFIFHRLFIN